ncbi:hypothetical protein P3X46_012335 [Hevea brasiliensis]|uniref:SBP-type domain-containing protein n=1 Tax=Hevea brasiliensis TaxID=3981 RepID=A0ABQ9MDR1_HEVBR|nr:squamosa promoter-binding-like protein 13 isoform X2 [Hevea brasiliensis]KAJ9177083.1 hypothetical protein P3X46_012335 [Hevea brasiliensis]
MDGKGKLRMMGNMTKKELTEHGWESSDDDLKMGCVESDVESSKKNKVVAGGGGGGGGRIGLGGGSGSGGMRSCQAEKCTADLSDAKPYHRRHKVCANHAKAQIVLVAGIRQRFCQQCSSVACFMSYGNLMKPKGVVGGVWPDTMNGEGRMLLNLIRKVQATKGQAVS